MAEISLDHFFHVVCRDVDNALLHKAIIYCVTTSNQYPRLRRAAQAWQPSTPAHRKFKRLMLAEDLQPLTEDQLTAPVVALMRTLQDWLRTNWYLKGEIGRSGNIRESSKQWMIKELTHGRTARYTNEQDTRQRRERIARRARACTNTFAHKCER